MEATSLETLLAAPLMALAAELPARLTALAALLPASLTACSVAPPVWPTDRAAEPARSASDGEWLCVPDPAYWLLGRGMLSTPLVVPVGRCGTPVP